MAWRASEFRLRCRRLATVVEPDALAEAFRCLATDGDLRRQMGAAGLQRAQQMFDWPVILQRYDELATELGEIRKQGLLRPAQPWPQRADPFLRFSHFSSATVGGDWRVHTRPDATIRLKELLPLSMANYAFAPHLLSPEIISALQTEAAKNDSHTVNSVLTAIGQATPEGIRALMWLWKFDLVQLIRPA